MKANVWIKCRHIIPAVTEIRSWSFGGQTHSWTSTKRDERKCRKEAAYIENAGDANEKPVCAEHGASIGRWRATTDADLAKWGQP